MKKAFVFVKLIAVSAIAGTTCVVMCIVLAYGFTMSQKKETPPVPKCTPKDCCKKLGAANDTRPLVDESCKAMRAGLRYIEEGLPQDRAMRADAREKLATAIVHAEVWLEATK